jgi:formylglycine-generating enzyme required for sulfatase activity
MVAAHSTTPTWLINSVGMRLQPIPAGHFVMGSPPHEEHRSADEGPQHPVHIKQPFLIGVFPVTQQEFEVVMAFNHSPLKQGQGGGPEHPVAGVSWKTALEFCTRLSRLPAERRAGRIYQLPTEAEWEYACRAGTTTPFAFGPSLSARQANFNGSFAYGEAGPGPFLARTTRVGSYAPNDWGLFDMHGNVWEWCNGYYYDDEHYRTCPRRPDDDFLPGGQPADPRVVRGGSWNSKGWKCRSADRYRVTPGTGTGTIGFRVFCSLSPQRGEDRTLHWQRSRQ